MKLTAFKFQLPKEQIALYPTKDRDGSKLMVLHRKDGKIEHKKFKNVLDYFNEGDTFILNNTRVFPARMWGNKEKTGAKIEVFMLRELNRDSLLWDVIVDPARKIRIGNKLYFGKDDELVAEVIDNTTSRGRTLRFLFDGTYEEFKSAITEMGETPLPRYIKRETEASDAERYQTIYAKHEGAVAAPTAGLHFSRELMKRMELKGMHFAEVTLHVGLGTFRPVEVEDLTKHKMDSEQVIINSEACKIVNKAKDTKKRVCCVGTTTMRAIESSVSTENHMKPYNGWTNKFIFPPYDFSIADSMITNFHMPESTLLMMVAAFGGYDHVWNAYKVAMKEKYRFFSYGDAMLDHLIMTKAAIIVAGGSGLRLGGPVPKQFQIVRGRPLLMWTIDAFHRYDASMSLIVVLPEMHFEIWKALCMGHRFFIEHQVVAGGEQRYHSVKAGLDKIEGDGLVAVHDGVRPLVSTELIARCFDAADKNAAATPVVPIVPSVRERTDDGSRALDRSRLLAVQTPQCFHTDLLRKAFALPYDPTFTDEATMVERLGKKVHLVDGEVNNIKVTTSTDLRLAEMFLG